MQHQIWVNTVCQCSFYVKLGINGLNKEFASLLEVVLSSSCTREANILLLLEYFPFEKGGNKFQLRRVLFLGGVSVHVPYTFHFLYLAEVMEAKRNADREELHKLKEQLLISFKDQMELRFVDKYCGLAVPL